jgi:hypothetical protein
MDFRLNEIPDNYMHPVTRAPLDFGRFHQLTMGEVAESNVN